MNGTLAQDSGVTIKVTYLPDYFAGEFNLDQIVDASDFTAWRDSFGQAVTPDTGADANFDGIVDDLDRIEWLGNFGAAAAAAVSVPESGFEMPWAVGLAGLSLVLRRRRGVS